MAYKITEQQIKDTEKRLLKMKQEYKEQEQKELNKKQVQKNDCLIYMTNEQKAVLQSAANKQGISVNHLLLNLIEKKYPVKKNMRKKVAAQTKPDETDLKQKEVRLREINQILKKAYNGQKLPPDKYHKLKNEKNKLIMELE